MIGRLRGLVAEIGEEDALIDVGGVGYVLRCGTRTLSRLPPLGDEALLHVETQWSEQAGLRLYGFLARDERRAFVALQSVQGVGPKDKPIADGAVAAFHAQVLPTHEPSTAGEAVAALMGLQVAEVTARRVVDAALIRLGEDAEIPAVIKAALQELGR
jgi:Holliday junction DNA helicase RuvA